MDGENNGNPYFLLDDLGGKPTIFGNTHIYMTYSEHLTLILQSLTTWSNLTSACRQVQEDRKKT